MNNITVFIIATVILICVAIALLIFEKKTKCEGGDERQLLEDMKSSTLGFYVLILLCLISYLAANLLKLPFHPEILFIISIVVSVTTAFVRKIWVDNVWSKFNLKFQYSLIFIMICAMDFRYISGYLKSHAIENLMLPICCSTCFIVCLITSLIRKLVKSNKSTDEAE